MAEHLLKCPKCGAVMVREGYHEYAWYLHGEKIEGGCPLEIELTKGGGRVLAESPGPPGKAKAPFSRKA